MPSDTMTLHLNYDYAACFGRYKDAITLDKYLQCLMSKVSELENVLEWVLLASEAKSFNGVDVCCNCFLTPLSDPISYQAFCLSSLLTNTMMCKELLTD